MEFAIAAAVYLLLVAAILRVIHLKKNVDHVGDRIDSDYVPGMEE